MSQPNDVDYESLLESFLSGMKKITIEDRIIYDDGEFYYETEDEIEKAFQMWLESRAEAAGDRMYAAWKDSESEREE